MAKHCNILVTGVGAIIGYGIVQSIRKCEYHCNIIGVDIFEDAIGRIWCDKFVQGVRANSPNYQEFILDLVKRLSINLIIPGIEQDVLALAKIRKELSSADVAVALNTDRCIEIFSSKLKTTRFLQENNFPFLEAYPAERTDCSTIEQAIGYPCIAKLDNSYAGKGQQVIYCERELQAYLGVEGYLLQRYINSACKKEFTVSVFGLGDGNFVNQIMLERTLGPDGATHKAKVIKIQELSRQIDLMCHIIKPLGPTNFQFICSDSDLPLFLLEVNPRISSSSSLRTAFGINEAAMCIEYYLHKKRPSELPVRGGTAQRFIADYIEYDCTDF